MEQQTLEHDIYDLTTALSDELQKGISEDAMEKIKKQCEEIVYQIQSDIGYRLESDLARNLAYHVQYMAKNAIEAMLKGNEKAFLSYIHGDKTGYTGRDRKHSVIHFKLFETGPLELRKQIVEAHADILKDQRILDLEDQVKSLVDQVNDLEARRSDLQMRYNALYQQVEAP